ncbi:MAG: substrate-binding domain-containing protein [Lachnospiraceae bacterium]|nr:substrate-binding domain-containing protein [Lachnospiraceae bacterium]
MKRRVLAVLAAIMMMMTSLMAGCRGGASNIRAEGSEGSTILSESEADGESIVENDGDAALPVAGEGDAAVLTETGEDESVASGQTPKYWNAKVAVALSERLDSRVGQMYVEMVSYMANGLGFQAENIDMLDCGLDANLQAEQVSILLGKKPDVMIIAPCDVNNVSEMTDMCANAGVPIVYIMSEPEESEEIRWEKEKIRACYIGPDGVRSGVDQGAIAASCPKCGDLNGDGVVKYVMLQGDPNDPTTLERSEYSIRELTERGVSSEMVLLARADWEREKAEKVIADALDRFGNEIEVIFCGNDEMALGAGDAVFKKGLKEGKDVYIIGAVGSPEAMKGILDRIITGTVFDDYKAQAEWAGNRAAEMIDGGAPETVFYTNPTKVTFANAAEIYEYCK